MIEHIDETEILPPDVPFLKQERLNQGDLRLEADDNRIIRVARSYAFPFDFYHRREWISDEQHQAGLQFASYFHRGFACHGAAQMRYVTTASGPFDPYMAVIYQQKFFAARRAVRGAKEQRVVYDVCCEGRTAGPREGMRRLKDALDDLVKHFG